MNFNHFRIVKMEKEDLYQKCLETTNLMNIKMGLLQPLDLYDRIHQAFPDIFQFPDIPLSSLEPPFAILPERKLTHSYIGVILNGPFQPRHDSLFVAKTPIDVNSINEELTSRKKPRRKVAFEYKPSYRNVAKDGLHDAHTGYSKLLSVLYETDCATVVEFKENERAYIATHFKAKIYDDDENLVDLIIEQCKQNNIRIRSKKNPAFRNRIRAKAYESVAWRGSSSGTKFFAASSFLYHCTDRKFVIDILSGAGVYTRINKDQSRKGREILITHMMPQRRSKFTGEIDEDWILGDSEKFVLYCVQYVRNNNFSPKRDVSWVDVIDEWIVNPEKPNREQGIHTNKLPKKHSIVHITE